MIDCELAPPLFGRIDGQLCQSRNFSRWHVQKSSPVAAITHTTSMSKIRNGSFDHHCALPSSAVANRENNKAFANKRTRIQHQRLKNTQPQYAQILLKQFCRCTRLYQILIGRELFKTHLKSMKNRHVWHPKEDTGVQLLGAIRSRQIWHVPVMPKKPFLAEGMSVQLVQSPQPNQVIVLLRRMLH